MKKVARLGLILWLCYFLPSSAENQNPPDLVYAVESSLWKYTVKQSELILGYSAGLLSGNYPLGSLEIKNPEEKPDTSTAEGLEKAFKSSTQLAEANNTKMQTDEKSLQQVMTISEGVTPTPEKPTETQPPPLGPEDFNSCLKGSLNLLKDLMRLESYSPETLDLGQQLVREQAITLLKLNLSQSIGKEGLPCARGHAQLNDVIAGPLPRQIKILSAIYARQGAEREKVIEVTAVAFNVKAPRELRPLWVWLWSEVSLQAVFSKEALRSLEETIEEIKEHPSAIEVLPDALADSFEMSLSFQISEPEKKLAQGYDFLKSLD